MTCLLALSQDLTVFLTLKFFGKQGQIGISFIPLVIHPPRVLGMWGVLCRMLGGGNASGRLGPWGPLWGHPWYLPLCQLHTQPVTSVPWFCLLHGPLAVPSAAPPLLLPLIVCWLVQEPPNPFPSPVHLTVSPQAHLDRAARGHQRVLSQPCRAA